jgi:cyclopropane fatty-acyl-phospholipid synthase-like methyltransferase
MFKKLVSKKRKGGTHQPKDVADFYNTYNDKFLAVYGEVIQAFRTTEVSKLLDYQAQMMQLKPGMKLLDAGCGVCGPAIYFAQHFGVEVTAVTISQVQFDAAQQRINNAGLAENVKVILGDYHELKQLVEKESYDVIYFLESFGHSPDHTKAINSAWTVLKPGGLLYIKDLFERKALLPEHQPKIDREIANINQAYRYNIADLNTVLNHLRQSGWILSAVKTIDLHVNDFENLTISNEFQELTGIGTIDNWADYVFPVDFFELLCVKPQHELAYGLDKYFLQNLMYMQVHHKKQEEL